MRKDTTKALKLARVAKKAVLASERPLSYNNLWNVVVGFVTASPEKWPKERSMSGNPRAKAHVVGAKTARTARLGSFFRSAVGRQHEW